ncbi:MAG: hypothetical protein IJG38_16720 [Thermoguttaceae bacterium]|nr:hypothetical protein [Thermoguttaceae bacterium]
MKKLGKNIKATNGSGYNTFRAAARIGSGASPPFFEKKVLPLKLPFPKNFSKGRISKLEHPKPIGENPFNP